jgi:hypothetical protein
MIAVKYENAVQKNGVSIARTPTGIAVHIGLRTTPVLVEVDYFGRRLKNELVDPATPFYRDYFKGVDMLRCVVRVKDNETILAELGLPEMESFLPFMVLQGPQRHITENYVSVPPALTITDEVGAVWTLGFKTAPKDLSPEGEYAFNVLRDGIDTGEIASRIERRGGRIRIFTRHGWKRWLGTNF